MASSLLDLNGRLALITGGGGFLGLQHAEAVAEAGGGVVLADMNLAAARRSAENIAGRYGTPAIGLQADVTDLRSLERLDKAIHWHMKRPIDILINNAAIDPKVGPKKAGKEFSRFENFPLQQWNREISVGLSGAFLCSQVFGAAMAKRGCGVILNIASDLSVIAPDQRIYRKKGIPEDKQPVKPVSYSVIKTGLIGLTKYLATYWANRGVRVNAISPGGMQRDQPNDFVRRVSQLIPMERMARIGEYKGAVLFLISDASSYVTGVNLVIDGGRSVW